MCKLILFVLKQRLRITVNASKRRPVACNSKSYALLVSCGRYKSSTSSNGRLVMLHLTEDPSQWELRRIAGPRNLLLVSHHQLWIYCRRPDPACPKTARMGSSHPDRWGAHVKSIAEVIVSVTFPKFSHIYQGILIGDELILGSHSPEGIWGMEGEKRLVET